MELQTITNIILSVLSCILVVISLVTVVLTLRQNSKMIEASSRPIISIYSQIINSGMSSFYLVVKNLGKSTAYLTKFTSDFDFSKCSMHPSKNYIEQLSSCTIAPGQSRICLLDYDKAVDNVHFSVEYKSATKTYSEEMDVNLKSAVGMPNIKSAESGKELISIAYSLQELIAKNL